MDKPDVRGMLTEIAKEICQPHRKRANAEQNDRHGRSNECDKERLYHPMHYDHASKSNCCEYIYIYILRALTAANRCRRAATTCFLQNNIPMTYGK